MLYMIHHQSLSDPDSMETIAMMRMDGDDSIRQLYRTWKNDVEKSHPLPSADYVFRYSMSRVEPIAELS